jgi:hypothetical protein
MLGPHVFVGGVHIELQGLAPCDVKWTSKRAYK